MTEREQSPIKIVFNKPISGFGILFLLILIRLWLPFIGLPIPGIVSYKMSGCFQFIFGFLVLFLAYMVIWNLKKLLSSKPAITITNTGIDDRSSPQAVGFIPWNDITEMETVRMGKWPVRTRYISLILKEPQEYLSKGNLLSRWIRKFNYVFTRSTVLITANHLDIRFEELMDLISDHLD